MKPFIGCGLPVQNARCEDLCVIEVSYVSQNGPARPRTSTYRPCTSRPCMPGVRRGSQGVRAVRDEAAEGGAHASAGSRDGRDGSLQATMEGNSRGRTAEQARSGGHGAATRSSAPRRPEASDGIRCAVTVDEWIDSGQAARVLSPCAHQIPRILAGQPFNPNPTTVGSASAARCAFAGAAHGDDVRVQPWRYGRPHLLRPAALGTHWRCTWPRAQYMTPCAVHGPVRCTWPRARYIRQSSRQSTSLVSPTWLPTVCVTTPWIRLIDSSPA